MINVINRIPQFPTKPYNLRYIGVVGDNSSCIRQFSIPKITEDLIDLSTFSPIIKIQPVDETQDSYYDYLDKEIIGDNIIVTWTAKNYSLVEDGKLYFNIQFSDPSEKAVRWQTKQDYFIVSERLLPYVNDCVIHSDVMGSDHCPVELILENKN
jgi:hypothetical protein